MKIPYNWLKEYVDVKIPPEKLAELLTMSGLSVESMKRKGDEHILEIEITSNRPDWLSLIGVAREVSALTNSRLKIPSLKDSAGQKKTGDEGIEIRVEDKQLCPRYTGRVIRNLTIAESPAWLKSRLEAMDSRPINNVVDITNFCLFETGEPMHAFDLDKIEGKRIIVRKAKKGEKIVTIDGVARELDDTMIVIADAAKPIAIAGVMGGLNTEVTAGTKNILLEAAAFDPISVRRTARKFALMTESSYRFERKVNIENILWASGRATELVQELAKGEPGSLTDIGCACEKKNEVDVRFGKVNKTAGIIIDPKETERILRALGVEIRSISGDKLVVAQPGFRADLNSEVDFVEEVIRVHGYDKIPVTVPDIVQQAERVPFDILVEREIRSCVAAMGVNEIITYSLLSKKFLENAQIDIGDRLLEIKNPLSSEQEVMRPTLLVGMLTTTAWNLNRKSRDLKLFELSKTYAKTAKGAVEEKKFLSIGLTGQAFSGWLDGSRNVCFYDLKGIVETLCEKLGIEKISFQAQKDSRFSFGVCATIQIGGDVVGILGELHKRVLNNFDIKEKVYYAEVCVETFSKHVVLKKHFEELPKYPSVYRDLSVVVGKEIISSDIIKLISETAGTILKEVSFIDRYDGKPIPADKVGLTYRMEYLDTKRTLEEKDISAVHSKIVAALEAKFAAKLR